MKPDLREVPIISIKVGNVTTDAEQVKALAASLDDLPLINPITVNHNMELIAGAHRYRAARLAGKTKIAVHVVQLDRDHQELLRIDENIRRKVLPALELADLYAARKRLYELLHPETKRGGDRKSIKARSARVDRPSFAADTAKTTGTKERTVQQYVQVSTKIAPKAKKKLKGTDAADSIKDLTKLAQLEPDHQVAVAERVAETGETVKQAARALKLEKQVAQARVYVPPTDEYEVITTDYPWEFDDELDGSDAVRGGCPYPPMPIEEICAFPIPCAKDCALFVWVTNQHTIDGSYDKVRQSLADRYGFVPKGLATWDKDKMGTGWWFRNQTEHLVLFVRGKPVFTEEKLRSLIRAPSGEHSEKPAAFYMAIERYCASTTRLEMFARAERKGWVTSGSELAAPPAEKDAKARKLHIDDCKGCAECGPASTIEWKPIAKKTVVPGLNIGGQGKYFVDHGELGIGKRTMYLLEPATDGRHAGLGIVFEDKQGVAWPGAFKSTESARAAAEAHERGGSIADVRGDFRAPIDDAAREEPIPFDAIAWTEKKHPSKVAVGVAPSGRRYFIEKHSKVSAAGKKIDGYTFRWFGPNGASSLEDFDRIDDAKANAGHAEQQRLKGAAA